MRHKIVAFVIVIVIVVLSIFNFVLAAPVALEIRKACTDAAEADDDVIIKRAVRGNPYERMYPDLGSPLPSSLRQKSDSTPFSNTFPDEWPSLGEPSKTKEVLVGGTLNLPLPPGRKGYLDKVAVQQSSPPEIEYESSPGGSSIYLPHPPESSSLVGGTLTLNLPLPPGRKEYLEKVAAQHSQSPEIERVSSSSDSGLSLLHFSESNDPAGGTLDLPVPPGRKGYLNKVAAQQSSSPEIERVSPLGGSNIYLPHPPDSESSSLVGSTLNLPLPPGRKGYLDKGTAQQSQLPETEHVSSSSDSDLSLLHFPESNDPAGGTLNLPLPPGRKGYLDEVAVQQSSPPEIEHVSSPGGSDIYLPHPPESSSLVGGTLNLPLPPGRKEYLEKVATQQSQSPETERMSSSSDSGLSLLHLPGSNDPVGGTLNLPLPPGQKGYLDKVAGQSPSSSPLPPMSKSKKIASGFKKIFGKFGKLNFRPRFQRTIDTGASTTENLGDAY